MEDIALFQKMNAIQNESIDAWKSQGKKVIGTVCCHVPEEIVEAAGMLAVRVRATGCTDQSTAEVWMSPFTCTFARSCLEFMLDGTYGFLDGMVNSDGCLTIGHLKDNVYHIDKERAQSGNFFLKKIEAPRNAHRHAYAFFEEELRRLCVDMEGVSGNKITDEKLWEAIELYNETRSLIREFYALRKADEPVISGTDSLKVMLAAMSMPKTEFNQAMREFLKDADKRPPIKDARVRLMIIGSALDDPEYVRIIEDAGGLVVADANCFGSRYLWEPVVAQDGESPIQTLSREYLDRPTCPRSMDIHDKLIDYILQTMKEYKVDGVIFERLKFCEVWGGEAAFFDEVFKKEDIPYITVEREEIMTNTGQLAVRAEAFIEMLEERSMQ
ncbi:MAG: 2-hydroxyacyl-CoA dehydratase family protein [Clostridiales Family XIII bacterium]|jgi:benzoyl-CoA reductase/2-hydroxyglutaryl-CoA dehydratase subunit BcrC/BadD/HgdB|nr:2-hydroxyacyl-CoA dehydratase family protein [Clostridiales Family XIII bacterium]